MSCDDNTAMAQPSPDQDPMLASPDTPLEVPPLLKRLSYISGEMIKKLSKPDSPDGPNLPRQTLHDPAEYRGRTDTPDVALALNSSRESYADMARAAYTIRRQRSGIFDSAEIFGEPAWDILLDLYIAHAEGKPVSVSSACIGSASPPTTGLRWLGVLTDHKLIQREHDPDDHRRILVRLTKRSLQAMDSYFELVIGSKGMSA